MSFSNFYKNRTGKYGRTRWTNDGYTFDSKLESAVYDLLKVRQEAGEIEILKTQDVVRLSDAEITYRADFKIRNVQENRIEWVEAKGVETDRWRIIKKLWKHYGPGRLEIWKGTYKKPFLKETIISKIGD